MSLTCLLEKLAQNKGREGIGEFSRLANSSLESHKRTLPRPQGLAGAAGKVCRGLSGAWELQRDWRVFKAGKRQP